MKKRYRWLSGIIMSLMLLGVGCGNEVSGSKAVNPEIEKGDELMVNNKEYSKMVIDSSKTYQTIESFGVSGAWWAQDVGGWDEAYKEGEKSVREEIAELLFDQEKGIGLTSYRYNVGAGSNSGNSAINDPWRRAQHFEREPGVYDWTKDSNAVWFLNKAVALGVEEVILFVNSPLERLTVNGKAHGTSKDKINLVKENYDAFATYMLDVTEHFIEEGIPVKFISPINEPQWDWTGGQEGCHYETREIVEILKVFQSEIEKRETLKGVELSGPESGEWGGKSKEYVTTILRDKDLGEVFKTIDNHSYWTNVETKKDFKRWMNINFPEVKLRTSEWCEMVNGMDFGMDSAFTLAEEVYDDLTVLDVVSWQLWIAVSRYDYHDGLIYVNPDKKAYRETKRLWGYGNFTKFIRPGYQRIEVRNNYKDILDLKSVAFESEDEIVIVIINKADQKAFQIEFEEEIAIKDIQIYTTTEEKDLEAGAIKTYTEGEVIELEAHSINTIIFSKNK